MSHFFKAFIILILLAFNLFVQAQRITYTINESWKFQKGDHPGARHIEYDEGDWQDISIPHTWNDKDAVDDEPGYYRGAGWYRKNVFIGNETPGKQLYAFFEGANQITELWVP